MSVSEIAVILEIALAQTSFPQNLDCEPPIHLTSMQFRAATYTKRDACRC